MGTSGAYGGSGGAGWGHARDDVANLPDHPSDEDLQGILQDVGLALDWDRRPAAAPAPAGAGLRPTSSDVSASSEHRPASGSGGGAGGTASPRSSGRAARSAARVLAAGYALRRRDAGLLADTGLRLVDLENLEPFEQCARILDILEVPSGIEQEELERAEEAILLDVLTSPDEPSPDELVRLFVEEYVYEVLLTEVGAQLRNGQRSGESVFKIEQRLRAIIVAYVEGADVVADSVSVPALENLIRDTLGLVRDTMLRPAS